MTNTSEPRAALRYPDRLFIGGEWVAPASSTTIDVTDSTSEAVFVSVAEALESDVDRAVDAARRAFDAGPWPAMSHAERAEHLRALGAGFAARADDLADAWPRETGALFSTARASGPEGEAIFRYYASLAETFPFEEPATPTAGKFGMLVREPVGVVGAIIPWNGPLRLIGYKVAPALIAGCTVVLKLSPEAPIEGYVLAEIAEDIGLPPGVLNVITADRGASEALVRSPKVDKITFTGSTAVGRRIGAICGERVARCTLELGGKSAAVILDDADIARTARHLVRQGCLLTGQGCSLLTRVVATRAVHDEMVDALAAEVAQVQVGDPFDERTQMGPLVSDRQRARVEGYIATGLADGATLVAGGGRPAQLPRGYYVEPTLFAAVDNRSTIAQEEIFGPVLTVVAADDEADAVRVANDSIYGLNASVFTRDVDRARAVARQLRCGTVGQNAFRTDFGIAFGGFKQSGIGREGGTEGLLPFLESKTVILDGPPAGFGAHDD